MSRRLAEGAVEGWCPGALRPMASGDGLIVRLKLAGGIVGLELAAAIARWSLDWGNGQIDLSNRANLQLRGVSALSLPGLLAEMADRALLDRSAAAEAVRNVMSSPLAGLDPASALDIRPIARALDRRLAGAAALHRLPGKFGFAIDDGGSRGLDDVPADIRFTACLDAGEPAFAVALDGAAGDRFGPCRPAALADVAAALGMAFLDQRRGREASIRRMGDLTALIGAAAIAEAAGLARIETPAGECRQLDILGTWALGSGAFVGLGLPFGRITGDALAGLASAAARAGAVELRLTPWRAVLVPVPSLASAEALSAVLSGSGFILDPADPRRRIAACPGAPACSRGTVPAREDAAALAPLLAGASGAGILLHVSGCDKFCAQRTPAPITLVGRNGAYRLVRNGAELEAQSLTIEQAADRLRRILHADHWQVPREQPA